MAPGAARWTNITPHLLNVNTPTCVRRTCGSSQQPGSVGRHQTGVGDQARIAHSHVEGASGNVAPVELDIDGVNAILAWNETDCTFVYEEKTNNNNNKKKVKIIPPAIIFSLLV